MNNIINESKSGDKNNIVNCCYHIYSHLMKFVENKNKLTSWVNTIIESIKQLKDIKNETYWRDVQNDPIKLNKIKNQAIAEYTNDGNKNADQYFAIVYSTFSNISLFRNYGNVKKYLIDIVEKENNNDMKNYIIAKFAEKGA